MRVTWPSPKADMFLLAPLDEIQNLKNNVINEGCLAFIRLNNMGKEDARADSRKRLRESGSQTDGEDAFDEADGHCRGASAKLDEVSEKLDKVLTRLGELEAMQGRVAELEKENKNLQESLNTAQADIGDLHLEGCPILSTPFLKAFTVFNVLENCRVYLLSIDVEIGKFMKKFIKWCFE